MENYLKIGRILFHHKTNLLWRCERNFFSTRHRKSTILKKTYSNLILNTWGIKEWLDFLPQLPPWPCAELKISTQSTLNDGEGKTLLLQLLEGLAGEVTTSPGLHPWHNTAKTFITELFHLTQDTSTEEDLFVIINGIKTCCLTT